VTEEDLAFQLDVNVLGPYRVTKAFAPLIIESRGRISTTGSLSGTVTWPLGGPYTMSKHAVEAFSEVLAAEMAGFKYIKYTQRHIVLTAQYQRRGIHHTEFPGNRFVILHVARFFGSIGKPQRTIELIQRAVETAPEDLELRFALARLGIDERARGETLTPEQFLDLSRLLTETPCSPEAEG